MKKILIFGVSAIVIIALISIVGFAQAKPNENSVFGPIKETTPGLNGVVFY